MRKATRHLIVAGLLAASVATVSTGSGTVLLADPRVSTFTLVDNLLFFITRPVGGSMRVWRTDGTPAGTTDLLDVGNGFVWAAHRVGSVFLVQVQTVSGSTELWSSDGSPSGTVLVASVPGMTSTLGTVGAKLYTAVPDISSSGRGLWASDGTTAGTGPILEGGAFAVAGLDPGPAWIFRGGLPLVELFQSDGTASGTVKIADIPTSSSEFDQLKVFPHVAEQLLLFHRDGVLWRSDGTEAGTMPIAPLPADSVEYAVDTAGTLYVASVDIASSARRLWRYEQGGLGLVVIVPESIAELVCGGPTLHGALGARVLYTGPDGDAAWALWSTDGSDQGPLRLATTTTRPAMHIVPPAKFPTCVPSGIGGVGILREKYIFVLDGQLWATDGTPAGTSALADVTVLASPPISTPTNGAFFFGGGDPSRGHIWRTDGTPTGTARFASLLTPASLAAATELQLFVTTAQGLLAIDLAMEPPDPFTTEKYDVSDLLSSLTCGPGSDTPRVRVRARVSKRLERLLDRARDRRAAARKAIERAIRILERVQRRVSSPRVRQRLGADCATVLAGRVEKQQQALASLPIS